jgi:hypothetical protein
MTVEGAGHDMAVTHAGLVTDALLAFLGGKDSWVLPLPSSRTSSLPPTISTTSAS